MSVTEACPLLGRPVGPLHLLAGVAQEEQEVVWKTMLDGKGGVLVRLSWTTDTFLFSTRAMAMATGNPGLQACSCVPRGTGESRRVCVCVEALQYPGVCLCVCRGTGVSRHVRVCLEAPENPGVCVCIEALEY